MNKAKKIIYAMVALSLTFTSCTTTAKDEPKPKPTVPTTVTDIDGNVYHTVTIGTQTWLVENLKTTKYRNGDLIGTTSPATKDITSESAPKYQWAYNGDETNVAKFGRLYTWYVVSDTRNIAPTGWHVATHDECMALEAYVSTHYGTSLSTGQALAATSEWNTFTPIGSNLAINNYSGFSALPGGCREINVVPLFYDYGIGGYWWNSTDFSPSGLPGGAWLCYMSRSTNLLTNVNSKSNGYSVRCVWDY